MSERPKLRKSAKADQFDAENELWETGELGRSSEHAVPTSDEHDKELDDAMGLQLLTFRLQKSLIAQFKELAKLEGIGYQPLMRQVLNRYARENEHRIQPQTKKRTIPKDAA